MSKSSTSKEGVWGGVSPKFFTTSKGVRGDKPEIFGKCCHFTIDFRKTFAKSTTFSTSKGVWWSTQKKTIIQGDQHPKKSPISKGGGARKNNFENKYLQY